MFRFDRLAEGDGLNEYIAKVRSQSLGSGWKRSSEPEVRMVPITGADQAARLGWTLEGPRGEAMRQIQLLAVSGREVVVVHLTGPNDASFHNELVDFEKIVSSMDLL